MLFVLGRKFDIWYAFTTNVVAESVDVIAQQTLHHAEDAINKLTAISFATEFLSKSSVTPSRFSQKKL